MCIALIMYHLFFPLINKFIKKTNNTDPCLVCSSKEKSNNLINQTFLKEKIKEKTRNHIFLIQRLMFQVIIIHLKSIKMMNLRNKL